MLYEERIYQKFWKENKTEIITIGISTIVSVGLGALGMSVYSRTKGGKECIEFINAVNEAADGCGQYLKIPMSEVIDMGGIVCDRLRDPEGKLLKVENIIAFGNVIEP